MISFKQYIAEGRGQIPLDIDGVIKQFEGDYSESLRFFKAGTIYRGKQHVQRLLFIQGAADEERVSVSGKDENHYNKLLDSAKANADWPKRGRSSISFN